MSQDLIAAEIAEDLLYLTGRALNGAWEADIGNLFEVPQIMETLGGKQLVETEDDVRELFAGVRAYFDETGVTDVVRSVVSAEFLSETTIGTTHVSQLMLSDGTAFRAPYPTYSVLRYSRGRWRIVSTIYGILDDPAHIEALSVATKPLPPPTVRPYPTPNAGNEGRRRP